MRNVTRYRVIRTQSSASIDSEVRYSLLISGVVGGGSLGAIANVTGLRDRGFTGAPFLKWAGGKTQLLTQFERFLPHDFRAYAEPFVGSGALFFHLRRTRGI